MRGAVRFCAQSCAFGVGTAVYSCSVRNETQRRSQANIHTAMTIRDPEAFGLQLDVPVIQRVEHLAHGIEELVIAGRTCDFGPLGVILLFWQEFTKRQIKQLFKATEKTLIANGF
jgi:hypothetical protein